MKRISLQTITNTDDMGIVGNLKHLFHAHHDNLKTNNRYIKRVIFHLLFVSLFIIVFACKFGLPPKAPTNLGKPDVPDGTVIGVYHYSGGVSSGMSIYLGWDEVESADGYILYIKNDKSKYEVIDSTKYNTTWIRQGKGTETYVVTAYNEYGESGYSNELEIVVK